ncbi:unnamed protein product [Zymoseptoria tritici ST99CH_3D1]|nr:unnamed protein product [Zymoseptoria tritici ST99CH_3D1]
MQFSTTVLAILATAGTSFAAPAPVPDVAVSKMVSNAQWTIRDFKRQCANGSCSFTYAIDNGATVTGCAYSVAANGGKSADQTDYSNIKCGDYTIGSGWSGQFGPGNGFTTLSVVDSSRKIIYPSYSDAAIANAGNGPVKPDQSYTPAQL